MFIYKLTPSCYLQVKILNHLFVSFRAALEKLTASKISSAMPVRCAEKVAPAEYIRYTHPIFILNILFGIKDKYFFPTLVITLGDVIALAKIIEKH